MINITPILYKQLEKKLCQQTTTTISSSSNSSQLALQKNNNTAYNNNNNNNPKTNKHNTTLFCVLKWLKLIKVLSQLKKVYFSSTTTTTTTTMSTTSHNNNNNNKYLNTRFIYQLYLSISFPYFTVPLKAVMKILLFLMCTILTIDGISRSREDVKTVDRSDAQHANQAWQQICQTFLKDKIQQSL